MPASHRPGRLAPRSRTGPQRLRRTARMWPTQAATSERTTTNRRYKPASEMSPRSNRIKVSRLIAEKVVKPPQIPPMTNCRPAGPTSMRPSGAVRAANSPITNEPSTLTKPVAHKALCPIMETITTPDRNRSSDPTAAPTPTARWSRNAVLLAASITASHQNPADGREACADGRDAKTRRKDRVQCGLQSLAVEREIERLPTKRRDRGVAAEEPDKGQIAKHFAGEYSAVRSGQSGERANDESPRDVHDQRAPRKRLTDPSPDKAGDEKAGDAAEKSSEQDEGAGFKVHGNRSPFGLSTRRRPTLIMSHPGQGRFRLRRNGSRSPFPR